APPHIYMLSLHDALPISPLEQERFHFTRQWAQEQALRMGDLRSQDFRTGRSLNLPPHCLLIHRVTAGAIGILCQLDAELPLRSRSEEHTSELQSRENLVC